MSEPGDLYALEIHLALLLEFQRGFIYPNAVVSRSFSTIARAAIGAVD